MYAHNEVVCNSFVVWRRHFEVSKKKLQNEDTKYKYEVKFFIVCGEEKIIKKKKKKKVKKGKRHRNDLAVTVKRWRDLHIDGVTIPKKGLDAETIHYLFLNQSSCE